MTRDHKGFDLDIMSNIMGDRDMFYGGHVNVFQPLVRADVDAGEHIRYIDIICAHYQLCTGHPTRLLGPEIDRRRLDPKHPDPYFGFFRGILFMPKDDMYGGLPYRTPAARSSSITTHISCAVFYQSFTNASTMVLGWAKYLRYCTFLNRSAARDPFVGMWPTITGIKWRPAGGAA
jgi:hypothetical protein